MRMPFQKIDLFYLTLALLLGGVYGFSLAI
jgi:hypothetical protein